jgi:hypothetical protein
VSTKEGDDGSHFNALVEEKVMEEVEVEAEDADKNEDLSGFDVLEPSTKGGDCCHVNAMVSYCFIYADCRYETNDCLS